MDLFSKPSTPILYSRKSQLPKKSDNPENLSTKLFNPESFPSAASKFNEPKEKRQIKSDFLFYDGANNKFSETQAPKKRKKNATEDKAIPRPTNSFICARSMLHKMFEKLNISTIECSNLMSDIWKNYNDDMFKHYFRYLAFLEACWHASVYPNYRYNPRKKVSSPKPSSCGIKKQSKSLIRKKLPKKGVKRPCQTTTSIISDKTNTCTNNTNMNLTIPRINYELEVIISELMREEQFYFNTPMIETMSTPLNCKPFQLDEFYDFNSHLTLSCLYDEI